ncbi:MAG: macro domain-containing protein [Fermentimonas sp.]|nr:macro domain-containing protein [Dysgonamonadaceae bacterium]MDD4697752.1 macro domain-containing protein [Fermentimonas sp.]
MKFIKFNLKDLIVFSTDEAILHGCNCKGIMGKGAAELIKKTYNVKMFADYVVDCRDGLYNPGDVQVFSQPGLPLLYNLAIQRRPGKHAKLNFVEESIRKAVMDMTQRGIKNASITPLGCFNAGLTPDEVINIIEKYATQSKITFTLYTRRQERHDEILPAKYFEKDQLCLLKFDRIYS